MPNEVGQVQVVAGKDVVFAEDFRRAAGFEPLLDVEMEGEPDVVEATGARSEDGDVDRPAEIETVSDPPDAELDGSRFLERKRFERRKADRFANLEFPARSQDAPDIDWLRHFSRFPGVKTTLQ